MAILLRSYNALIPLSHALDTLVLTMFNINGGFMKLYDVRDSTTTLPRSWRPSLDLPQWYRDWSRLGNKLRARYSRSPV